MSAWKGSSTHLISPEMAGKDVMNLSLSVLIYWLWGILATLAGHPGSSALGFFYSA